MRKNSDIPLLVIFITLIISLKTSIVYADEICISCHSDLTPGIIEQYKQSKHFDEDIGCKICHVTTAVDPSGFDHSGFRITSVVSPEACSNCHNKEVEEFSKSKHAWTAFIGPLKPWYQEMSNQGKDPFDMQTALENDPRDYIKSLVTPLYPDSGALENAGLLDQDEYYHENQILGCIQCHGSYVTAEDGEITGGWPNTGIGRVNPDGSLGSCSSCHTRHRFKVEEARKPETCGQCHLGPDHPQMEIYEESKHGNIYFSSGEEWDWSDSDWGVDDIIAPTCATCHMSGFNNIVDTTHEVGERLYWELQPKKSVPQWDSVELIPLGQQTPDEVKAESGRTEMKKVCGVCHADSWVNGYFESFDKVVSDYNMVYDYSFALLNTAYEEELIDQSNPLDETPEIMYYYIWHHDGRRWRMGASMMGPDWTHWNGAVDAALDKLNNMEESIDELRKVKSFENILDDLENEIKTVEGVPGPQGPQGPPGPQGIPGEEGFSILTPISLGLAILAFVFGVSAFLKSRD
jgi:formate-dependent nitrite reductase cytochrome c552 subunit